MFINLSTNNQETILCIKIIEIEMSEDYNRKDKDQMIRFYRKKLKEVQPKRNF